MGSPVVYVLEIYLRQWRCSSRNFCYCALPDGWCRVEDCIKCTKISLCHEGAGVLVHACKDHQLELGILHAWALTCALFVDAISYPHCTSFVNAYGQWYLDGRRPSPPFGPRPSLPVLPSISTYCCALAGVAPLPWTLQKLTS